MSVKKMTIQGTPVTVTFVRHYRAKRLKLTVSSRDKIKVTLPRLVPMFIAMRFINQNHSWISDRLNKQQYLPSKRTYTPQQLTELKIKTRHLVKERLAYFNQHYHFDYHRITIRNQKTRWGSCSNKKTLSFNCKLCLLPTDISDYVIVHELCHLKEMNHSLKFWRLVAQTVPNHKSLRRQLNRQAKVI